MQANTPKALRLVYLHRDCNDRFRCFVLPTAHLGRVFPYYSATWTSDVRFINLHLTRELVATRTHHGPAQPMQHRPRRLIAAQAQGSLKTQCADPVLLIGQVPCRREPAAQWRARLRKDRAGRHRSLITAATTHQTRTRRSVGLTRFGASRTDESLGPPKPLKIIHTSHLIRIPIQKLGPVLGVISARDQSGQWFSHHYILTALELSG